MASLKERVVSSIQEFVKTVKEDWTTLPFLVIASTGLVVAMLDFILFQNLEFQVFALAGLVILLIGWYIRTKARFELKNKAGFGSLVATGRLQIVEGHRLVRDGLYEYIRHPIYLGEILRNFGFVIVFSSVYGVLFMGIATIFLLFRIRIEEKMLIQAFGEEYKEYQRNTKRIIPYMY